LVLGVNVAVAQTSIVVPLDQPSGWQVLEFRRIPPHRVRFTAAGLEMRVESSAMPVIYPLPKPARVAAVRVKGRVDGTLRLPPGRQGEPGFDDYAFRIGLVEPGPRTLNFVQRQVAAPWVRRLFELAPPGSGMSGIRFFNVGTAREQVGRRRQHPSSDLLTEEVVSALPADGRFDFTHTLDRPLDAIAVWLSSDGDDTASSFTVLVEEIELRVTENR
jgi:hypothetical protein